MAGCIKLIKVVVYLENDPDGNNISLMFHEGLCSFALAQTLTLMIQYFCGNLETKSAATWGPKLSRLVF